MIFFPIANVVSPQELITLRAERRYKVIGGNKLCRMGVMIEDNVLAEIFLDIQLTIEGKVIPITIRPFNIKYNGVNNYVDTYLVDAFTFIKDNFEDTKIDHLKVHKVGWYKDGNANSVAVEALFDSSKDKTKTIYPWINLTGIAENIFEPTIRIDPADLANFKTACQLIEVEVEFHGITNGRIEFELRRELTEDEKELLELYGNWL